MRKGLAAFRAGYGAGPLHLLVLVASGALLAYILGVLGLTALWDTEVWWQSILVWFLGAIVLHDLVLFPLYALADRSLSSALGAVRARRSTPLSVSPTNYVRVPMLASGLLFLLFFPGLLQQGSSSYLAATGQTQEPFLGRWLLLTAVIFGLSAVAYALRVAICRRRAGPAADEPVPVKERRQRKELS